MSREVRDFSYLLGKLTGISDAQLKAHFKLYEGYVSKLNEIEEKLKTTDKDLTNYSYGEYSELKRRYCVPYNGAFLHELYFENLGPTQDKAGQEFVSRVSNQYGAYEDWVADLKSAGLSVPGWVVTSLETTTGTLQNIQMMEHHVGFPINHVPILVLDVWEHAMFLDYQTNRMAYMDAFLKNVNWSLINARLSSAIQRFEL
jgi:Fe-Mn family superoxide dismutase